MSTTQTSPAYDQLEIAAAIIADLRQPMSSIVGYTDFLLGEQVGILSTNQRKFLERVKVSTERMEHLMNDLMQVISPESNPQAISPEAVDLSAAIDAAIDCTGPQLRQKNIVLRVDLPDQLPHLYADQPALEKVLVDLLKNAGEVTPEKGDILLRARVESSEGRQDYVMVQIADQGNGIASEELPKIFSPLPPSENSAGNNGINLSGVKSLVEVMGGRIWVDSQPGQGSAFSILLPVAEGGEYEAEFGGGA
jgi:signal transduction histidine kinase